MKIPCELIVWHALPMIRRELAVELVGSHGMSQADVARKFGMSDAAVSQYIGKKRGTRPEFDPEDPAGIIFMEAIRESARRIAEENADPSVEMCKLCGTFRKTGLLDREFLAQTGSPPPKCSCYPGTDQRTGRSFRGMATDAKLRR
ncbi:MAG: transcriptional regulator [Candidatus Methanomethylophilaceae archaeon]|jgi:predicted transcriptional regulator|nr:transcriptional regulator [Candidatus Methanomethylophilaceae archaeon]